MSRTADDRALLNLGCGTTTHAEWNNVDFSVYTRLRQQPGAAKLLHRAGVLSEQRWERLSALDPAIVSWDLRRGVPFADDTFDVVYHSHLLEHIPRDGSCELVVECHRVLAPGGVLRVVVPDLEHLATSYLDAVRRLDAGDGTAWTDYDRTVDGMFEQMVRTEGVGTAQQPTVVRVAERLIRGGPNRIGELHRWMYDRHTLERLLDGAGFVDVTLHRHDTSQIPSWDRFGLDRRSDGTPTKRDSLYVEARKRK